MEKSLDCRPSPTLCLLAFGQTSRHVTFLSNLVALRRPLVSPHNSFSRKQRPRPTLCELELESWLLLPRGVGGRRPGPLDSLTIVSLDVGVDVGTIVQESRGDPEAEGTRRLTRPVAILLAARFLPTPLVWPPDPGTLPKTPGSPQETRAQGSQTGFLWGEPGRPQPQSLDESSRPGSYSPWWLTGFSGTRVPTG